MALADELDVDVPTLRVKNRESPRREFKLGYDRPALARYAKTMAAFANADGGVIIFGVKASPRELVGADSESVPDEAEITTQLQNWFDPSPVFEVEQADVAGKVIVAIRVEQAHIKPVICKKTVTGKKPAKVPGAPATDEAVITEGDIYYRYSGKTDRIRFADLVRIFEERDQRRFDALMGAMAAVQKTGPERVGIVDISAAADDSERKPTRILVPREALRSLNLIDRGRFVESRDDGAPAFFMVGDVEIGWSEMVPGDDKDRLLPAEEAAVLAVEARRLLHSDAKIAAQHLANFAKRRGFRKGQAEGQHNTRFCKYDEKAGRWFYRQAFIDLVRRAMSDDPVGAAVDFGLSLSVVEAIKDAKAKGGKKGKPKL